MPRSSGDEPIFFDRSKLARPPKKSTSPLVKILLALFGAGFLMFACCAGIFIKGVFEGVQNARNGDPDKPARIASGEQGFNDADRQIKFHTEEANHGNSEDARNLAVTFSTEIKGVREAKFTKRLKKPLLQFKTYCHLDENVCVFLVYVPELKHFTDDAKAGLADLAWATAQDIIRSNLKSPPPQLAIGIRGSNYERVLIGRCQADENSEDAGVRTLKLGSGSEKALYPFFKPVPLAETPQAADSLPTGEMPGEDQSDAKPEKVEESPKDPARDSPAASTEDDPAETKSGEP